MMFFLNSLTETSDGRYQRFCPTARNREKYRGTLADCKQISK